MTRSHAIRRDAGISVLLAALLTTLAGCELIGDIFKLGFWLAIIVVAVVVFIGFAILRAVRRRF